MTLHYASMTLAMSYRINQATLMIFWKRKWTAPLEIPFVRNANMLRSRLR